MKRKIILSLASMAAAASAGTAMAAVNFENTVVGPGVATDFRFFRLLDGGSNAIPGSSPEGRTITGGNIRCFDSDSAATSASGGAVTTATCPPGSSLQIAAGTTIRFDFGTTRGADDIGTAFFNVPTDTIGIQGALRNSMGSAFRADIPAMADEFFVRVTSDDTFAVNWLLFTLEASTIERNPADGFLLGQEPLGEVPVPAAALLMGAALPFLRRRRG